MFKDNYQKGCLSVFYSIGSAPLNIWEIHTKNGYAKRVLDEDLNSLVFEMIGSNVSTTYMTTPKDPQGRLGIKLPFFVLVIKNMHKYFTFECKIVDDTNFMRRFRVSNFQSKTSVKPFCTAMPMGMSPGWNQIHFNLAEFTRRAYGTNYLETIRLQIHANVRVRRIYFSDRLYTEDNLPNNFRLIPIPKERRIMKDYKTPQARPPSPAKSTATEVSGDETAAKKAEITIKSEMPTVEDSASKASMVPTAERPSRSPSLLEVPRGSAVAKGGSGKRNSRKSTSKGGSKLSMVTAAERPSRSPSLLEVPRGSAVAKGAAGKRNSRKSTSKGGSKVSMVTAAERPSRSPSLLEVPRGSAVTKGGAGKRISRKSTSKASMQTAARSPSTTQVPRGSATAKGKRKSRKSTSRSGSKASMVTAAEPSAGNPATLQVPL